ncbi:hypothetical protein EB151_03320 [archaeon]|nr:hypothetical protein [archaeon]
MKNLLQIPKSRLIALSSFIILFGNFVFGQINEYPSQNSQFQIEIDWLNTEISFRVKIMGSLSPIKISLMN